MNFIQNIDINILYFIQNNIQNKFLNPIMIFFTSLGNLGFIWIAISILLIISKKYRKIGLLTLAVLIVNTLLGEGILKYIIERPRPFATYEGLHIIIPKPSSYSMPSGHTSASFAAAFMLAYYFKNIRVYIYSLASLIAFSRIYLLVHYPSDVLTGALLGYLSFLIVRKSYSLIKNKEDQRKSF
ncbi:TPA: phosphatase PAP2 family protein [Clostridium perfringens]|nr:phosphatase PAP2 family protein [Clostridium perfringens]HAT4346601.1 phosphatase PAP2 family protein [Clostridium perfringens]